MKSSLETERGDWLDNKRRASLGEDLPLRVDVLFLPVVDDVLLLYDLQRERDVLVPHLHLQIQAANWVVAARATLRFHLCGRLTSSTRPNPPTPSVATTSRWSKGLDEENTDTISFRQITSDGSGWLWWRDTDFFLDGDTSDRTSEHQRGIWKGSGEERGLRRRCSACRDLACLFLSSRSSVAT